MWTSDRTFTLEPQILCAVAASSNMTSESSCAFRFCWFF